MNTEQMRQKSSEARKAAKALQQQLQTVTDPAERKLLARQINDLLTQASKWRDEAKQHYRLEEAIEREFNSIHAEE